MLKTIIAALILWAPSAPPATAPSEAECEYVRICRTNETSLEVECKWVRMCATASSPRPQRAP